MTDSEDAKRAQRERVSIDNISPDRVAAAWRDAIIKEEGASPRVDHTAGGVVSAPVPPAGGTANTPETSRAARVSAANALVAIRRRTGRPIPDDVLQLAQQD